MGNLKVNGKPVLARGKDGVAVPGDVLDQVAWVMGRQEMTDSDLARAFPAMEQAARREFIDNLVRMKVLS